MTRRNPYHRNNDPLKWAMFERLATFGFSIGDYEIRLINELAPVKQEVQPHESSSNQDVKIALQKRYEQGYKDGHDDGMKAGREAERERQTTIMTAASVGRGQQQVGHDPLPVFDSNVPEPPAKPESPSPQHPGARPKRPRNKGKSRK